MTAPLDTSIPRKKLPSWTKEAQSFWIEMLSQYSECLMGLHAGPEFSEHDEEERDTLTVDRNQEITAFTEQEAGVFESDIELAARLADRAVQEMQYRFAIQEIPRQENRRAKRKRPTRGKR